MDANIRRQILENSGYKIDLSDADLMKIPEERILREAPYDPNEKISDVDLARLKVKMTSNESDPKALETIQKALPNMYVTQRKDEDRRIYGWTGKKFVALDPNTTELLDVADVAPQALVTGAQLLAKTPTLGWAGLALEPLLAYGTEKARAKAGQILGTRSDSGDEDATNAAMSAAIFPVLGLGLKGTGHVASHIPGVASLTEMITSLPRKSIGRAYGKTYQPYPEGIIPKVGEFLKRSLTDQEDKTFLKEVDKLAKAEKGGAEYFSLLDKIKQVSGALTERASSAKRRAGRILEEERNKLASEYGMIDIKGEAIGNLVSEAENKIAKLRSNNNPADNAIADSIESWLMDNLGDTALTKMVGRKTPTPKYGPADFAGNALPIDRFQSLEELHRMKERIKGDAQAFSRYGEKHHTAPGEVQSLATRLRDLISKTEDEVAKRVEEKILETTGMHTNTATRFKRAKDYYGYTRGRAARMEEQYPKDAKKAFANMIGSNADFFGSAEKESIKLLPEEARLADILSSVPSRGTVRGTVSKYDLSSPDIGALRAASYGIGGKTLGLADLLRKFATSAPAETKLGLTTTGLASFLGKHPWEQPKSNKYEEE